jgi:hypothetical protein
VLDTGVTMILCWSRLLVPAIQSTLLLAMTVGGLAYFSARDWLKVVIFARLNLR